MIIRDQRIRRNLLNIINHKRLNCAKLLIHLVRLGSHRILDKSKSYPGTVGSGIRGWKYPKIRRVEGPRRFTEAIAAVDIRRELTAVLL